MPQEVRSDDNQNRDVSNTSIDAGMENAYIHVNFTVLRYERFPPGGTFESIRLLLHFVDAVSCVVVWIRVDRFLV